MLLAVWLIIGGAAIGAGNDAIGDNARMPDPLAGYTAVVSESTGKTLYWTKK